MEYLDLYDQNKQLTGEYIKREESKNIKDGRYINIILLFIENSKNEFLIQYCSKERKNEIATTGGHVKRGDTSVETVIKETYEELGLKITPDDFKLFGTYLFFDKAFFDVYYMKKDIDIDKLKLQKEEVDEVKYLSKEKILTLIKDNKFRKSNVKPFLDLISENNK